MTKYPMTKEIRRTNDEMLSRAVKNYPRQVFSSFGLRHSFVIGYFVIRHSLLLAVGSLHGEELLQERAAFRLEHAAEHSSLVIQPSVAGDLVESVTRPGLRVGSAVDDRRNAREHDRAGAHRARFQRDVHRAVD